MIGIDGVDTLLRLETMQIARASSSERLAWFAEAFALPFAQATGLRAVREEVNTGPVVPDADLVVRLFECDDGSFDVVLTTGPCGTASLNFDAGNTVLGVGSIRSSTSIVRTPPASTRDEFASCGTFAAGAVAGQLKSTLERAWDWDDLGPQWFAPTTGPVEAPQWPPSAAIAFLGDVRRPLEHVHRAHAVTFPLDVDVKDCLAAWTRTLEEAGFARSDVGSGPSSIERVHVVRGDESIRLVPVIVKPGHDSDPRAFVAYHVRKFSNAERDAVIADWLASGPTVDRVQRMPPRVLTAHSVDYASDWLERIDRSDPADVLWIAQATREFGEFQPRIADLVDDALVEAVRRTDSAKLADALADVVVEQGRAVEPILTDDAMRDAGWTILEPGRIEEVDLVLGSIDTMFLATRDPWKRWVAVTLSVEAHPRQPGQFQLVFTRLIDRVGVDYVDHESSDFVTAPTERSFRMAGRGMIVRIAPRDADPEALTACIELME